MPPPIIGEPGGLAGTTDIPLTTPLAYVPCRGELGVVLNGGFHPLETSVPLNDDAPLVSTLQTIDREAPWLDQVDMRVATPCIAPYNWPAGGTVQILDTVPDVDATPEEKALPGYVPNPGLTLSSRSTDPGATDISISNIVIGQVYQISLVGNSDFTLVGASTNAIGIPFIATTPDFIATTLTASKVYKIKTLGTTDFTLIGAASNTVGLTFTATSAGTGDGVATVAGTGTVKDSIGFLWTFGSAPAIPHPALRAGQTRYSGISGAAVGTPYAGKAFIPGAAGAFVGGTLKVSGFVRGMLLSTVSSYSINVKLGRATATWSKSAQTLTLSSDSAGASFKYSLDGSAPTTTYVGPISITATKTVRWYASKTGLLNSTEWQTVVTFSGDPTEGPEDFATVYFSSLPTFSNSPILTALKFQRRADWYVAPGASGDGLTPSTPGALDTIVGLTTTSGGGKAKGSRQITVTKSGTANIALTRAGENPTGSLMKYSIDGSVWTTYSVAFGLPLPGRFWCKLVRADATDFTRIFQQPWFIGTGMSVRAAWDKDAATLTLSPTPTPTETEDYEILYSLDGSAPSLLYTAPLTIVSSTTPKYILRHNYREPDDFPSASAAVTGTAIDLTLPTPSYSEDIAVALAVTTVTPFGVHVQTADIVWLAEGTYSNPSGTAGTYFYSTSAIVIRGGFNSTFTERDVLGRKSIIKAMAWNDGTSTANVNTYNIYLENGTIDGCHGESETADYYAATAGLTRTAEARSASLLYADTCYNCHVVYEDTRPIAAGGSSHKVNPTVNPTTPSVYMQSHTNFFEGPFVKNCSVYARIILPDSEDGLAPSAYPDPEYDQDIRGGYAGQYLEAMTLGRPSVVPWYNCNVDVQINGSDAGTGGEGPILDYSGYPTGAYYVTSRGGQGATYTATITMSCGLDCCPSIRAIIALGDGGDGGDGGLCKCQTTPDPPGGPYAVSYGGYGAGNVASIQLSSITNCTDVEISTTSGDGGNGGNGGNADGPIGSGSFGGNGGTPQASSIITTFLNSKPCDISAISGNAGSGGLAGTATSTGDGIDGNSASVTTFNMTMQSEVTATATSGTGILSTATVTQSGDSFDCTLAGTCKRLAWAPSPTYFADGALTITESVADMAGNPIRVNHGAGSTVGWYSGLDNGDGAPLDGYETPKGTGVALGHYWE